MPLRRLTLLLLLCAAGCAPAAAQPAPDVALVPTLAPTSTPDDFTLEGALRTATLYLEAWRTSDWAAMHSHIAFAAQDVTPLAAFQAIYEDAATLMTLRSLDVQVLALRRSQPAVAELVYSVTFDTTVLGSFTDADRTLHLVWDDTQSAWRVAWSRADLFRALGDGGTLRLERQVPARANIYDRHGVVLADSQGRMVDVQVIPRQMPNPARCAETLARALNRPLTFVQQRLGAAGTDWLADIGTLEPSAYLEAQAALEQDCAARFAQRLVRQYPEGTLAPNIVGYVGFAEESALPAMRAAGFDADSILGQTGIERSWDATLRGQPGGRLSIMRGDQQVRVLAERAPAPAHSVWLTLDAELQRQVAAILARAYANSAWSAGSRGAAAVVLDVHTGAVLAMVSYPTYDANAFTAFPVIGRAAAQASVQAATNDPRRPLLNRPAQGLYPSGSVMKAATAIAAIESGVYTPDQRYVCGGRWQREPNFVRFDWNAGHGALTLPLALAQSCNPYFYEAGYQLDRAAPDLLPTYFRRLGLGVPTGMTDLPEEPGQVLDPDLLRTRYGLPWTFSRTVNMAIGQDLDITPLQMTRVYATIANGGIVYAPQLVARTGLIGEPDSYTMTPRVMEDLDLAPATLDALNAGLCAVPNAAYGTAEFQFRNERVQSIGICGKTGTAQAPGEGAISHAWFAAYAPQAAPQIAVMVLVENSGEGSGVAAPIVRDILDVIYFGLAASPAR